MPETDHIFQSTFKFKNTWIYNSPTPYVFVWRLIKYRDNCAECFKAIFIPLGGILKRSVCSDSNVSSSRQALVISAGDLYTFQRK